MNERIKQLMPGSWTFSTPEQGLYTQEQMEKFAKLIVRECAKSLWTEECHNSDLALEEFERNSAKIKEHFGVEE
jgi:hypothetical protein